MAAKDRNFDPQPGGRIQNQRPLGNRHLAIVDSQRYKIGHSFIRFSFRKSSRNATN
jgi:hypothetical protein